jgi:hypothetical protein
MQPISFETIYLHSGRLQQIPIEYSEEETKQIGLLQIFYRKYCSSLEGLIFNENLSARMK